MKWGLLAVLFLTACHKEPRYLSVTECAAAEKQRDVENCTSPGSEAAGYAIIGAVLLGPLGLLAGVPSATEKQKCVKSVESYCEKYETKQIENKNYHGDVWDWGAE